ncbi:MAG: phosphatase [Bacteroidetes bacterium]|nr:phosphatase [Bacteroidota bacterium]
MHSIQETAAHFKGQFITAPEVIAERLHQIKAFVFDWDGVFNAGWKNNAGESPFNEVDSMGTNLLRFNHHLRNQLQAITAIITGENNQAAIGFAQREHFHALYCGAKNKSAAMQHLHQAFGILEAEIAFFFDDVLDFSVAKECGLRIMIGRDCNPLLIQYALREGMVDYLTASDGAHHAVREVMELLAGLSGCYDEMLEERAVFSNRYQEYFSERNAIITQLFSFRDGKIVPR